MTVNLPLVTLVTVEITETPFCGFLTKIRQRVLRHRSLSGLVPKGYLPGEVMPHISYTNKVFKLSIFPLG